MQRHREPTVPIAVWLPALIAGAVIVLYWRSPASEPVRLVAAVPHEAMSRERPTPVAVSEPPPRAVPSVEAAAPPPTDSALVVVPRKASVPDTPAPIAPADREPAPTDNDSATEQPGGSEIVPPAPRLPSGFTSLAADPAGRFDDSPFGRSALRWVRAVRRHLGESAVLHACSGSSLAPFVVVLPIGEEARAVDCIAFEKEFRADVIEPARLTTSLQEALLVACDVGLAAVDPELRPRDRLDFTADLASGAVRERLAEAWLFAEFAQRGGAPPPEWWWRGALSIAAAGGVDAGFALPARLRLTELLDPDGPARRRENELRSAALADAAVDAELTQARHAFADTAGAFAAFCLGAGQLDAHLRSTWLEFGGSGAPSAPDSAELAARFGCAALGELERRFTAARGG